MKRIAHHRHLFAASSVFLVITSTGSGESMTNMAAPQEDFAGQTLTVDLGDGVTMDLVWIPPGEFIMGSPRSEAGRKGDEGPQHLVRITWGFWMGKYEVAQAQWQAVMESNPSHFTGDDRLPVERVSWDDCQAFLRALSGKTEAVFRLPTEAEWEYACRAGTTTAYYFGDDASRIDAYVWYDKNSDSRTHPVGQKKPNAWGLYDMLGNVREWCEDWYDKDFYSRSPDEDPHNTKPGEGFRQGTLQ